MCQRVTGKDASQPLRSADGAQTPLRGLCVFSLKAHSATVGSDFIPGLQRGTLRLEK